MPRRMRQKNSQKSGGAQRTALYCPYDVIVVVRGFHNTSFTKKFEWAVKHPDESIFFTNVEADTRAIISKAVSEQRKRLLHQLALPEYGGARSSFGAFGRFTIVPGDAVGGARTN